MGKDKYYYLKKEWAEKNKDKVRNSRRRYQERNVEKLRKIKGKYKREHKSKYAIYQKRYAKRHPEIIKAHNLKNSHKISLKDKCEFCNYNFGLEGHHPDYSKPDFIITVCKSCHSKIHYRGGK